MIKVDQVDFIYNLGSRAEIQALAGINVVVNHGEFVAVIGHNGCGKSTLSKHLNALLMPVKGRVTIDGMDTADEEKLWDIRRKCGMVFQNPDNQMVATVVEEEVAFGPENLGIDPVIIRERISTAIEAVGIAGMEKQSSAHLSGGQKQRLAIAGIIAMHPDYMILDEATSMLDPRGRDEVMRTVRQLNRDHKITIIFITHSMEEAARADRVIVMDKGTIVMEGPPGEIFSQADCLRSLSLEVPPMTDLADRLRKMGFEVPRGILDTEQMADWIESVLQEQQEGE